MLFAGCDKENTVEPPVFSSSPIARFSITPPAGVIGTEFVIDASSSFDTEDAPADLEVRWDWEMDGVWDTDYSTEKIATRRYTIDGTFPIALQVRDASGLTDSTMNFVHIFPPLTCSAAAAPLTGPAPLDVMFTSSQTGGHGVFAFIWTFGDGSADSTEAPSHRFESAGVYDVVLRVRDLAFYQECLDTLVIDVSLPDSLRRAPDRRDERIAKPSHRSGGSSSL